MNLESAVQAFRSLRKAPRPSSPRTLDKQPHKPLLLLSALDLIETGYCVPEAIPLSPELAEIFDSYWRTALPFDPPGNIATPFAHLASEGFWERRSPRLAAFDPDWVAAVSDRDAVNTLRAVLIEAHFSAEAAEDLRVRARTSEAALVYARHLLHETKERSLPDAVRSQAFRIAVVRAYDYRCAICGVRIVNEDGRAVVEAAHIIPWAKSKDDSPQNGLSLCRLCHWTFDAGMLAVSDAYLVLTSSRMNRDRNHPGILSVVANREIIKPADTPLWPALEKLGWHRTNVFLA